MHQPGLPVTFLFTDCFAHVFLLYYNSVAGFDNNFVEERGLWSEIRFML